MHVAAAAALPATRTAIVPEVRAFARGQLVLARDAVNDAIVSTTATDRINPALAYWSHRAVSAIGTAGALIQAVDGLSRLSGVPITDVVYFNVFDEARRLIVDAASAVQAGRPADPTAFARANAALRTLLHQLDFDITRHDPASSAPRTLA